MLAGTRATRFTSLALLSCCRSSVARSSHLAASNLVRSLASHGAAPRAAMWLRLRGGAVPAANLTSSTALDMTKPVSIKTPEEFEHALHDAGDKLVVVDFTATWCGPCKVIGPVFDDVAADNEGRVVCLKVDVDENPEIAQDCGIRAMPTFQFYKNGTRVAEFAGADEARLLTTVAEFA